MLTLNFGDANAVTSVLCLGAHGDDIEIGAGGTLIELVKRYPKATFHWVVFSGDEERARETKESARRFLDGAGASTLVIKSFETTFFPYEGHAIKRCFEELKGEVSPDIIFTHYRHDRNQDHRTISELTWNTFRDHLVLEYEIPKYDGESGSPNFFVPLPDEVREEKVRIILECYESQRARHWFTEETFNGMMRLRGIESNAPSGYAEAFYARKLVV
ncbi:MAG: PIG-L family deacetylase [Gammaproteobacteria bacterium]|nr:PIG-L family deacetylase [Gammaproteobacteria bacterium]